MSSRACLSSPAFSADGAKVVYSVSGRLAVSDVDGSNRMLLPRLTDFDGEPTWTKRGKLLFTGKRGSLRNLYFLDPDGTGLRQLTRNGGRSATYSNGRADRLRGARLDPACATQRQRWPALRERRKPGLLAFREVDRLQRPRRALRKEDEETREAETNCYPGGCRRSSRRVAGGCSTRSSVTPIQTPSEAAPSSRLPHGASASA